MIDQYHQRFALIRIEIDPPNKFVQNRLIGDIIYLQRMSPYGAPELFSKENIYRCRILSIKRSHR